MTEPLTPEERNDLRELCERTNREGFFETEFVNAIDPDDILRLLDQVESLEAELDKLRTVAQALFETDNDIVFYERVDALARALEGEA